MPNDEVTAIDVYVRDSNDTGGDDNFEMKACRAEFLVGVDCGMMTTSTSDDPGNVVVSIVDLSALATAGTNYWHYLYVDLPAKGSTAATYGYFTGYEVQYE